MNRRIAFALGLAFLFFLFLAGNASASVVVQDFNTYKNASNIWAGRTCSISGTWICSRGSYVYCSIDNGCDASLDGNWSTFATGTGSTYGALIYYNYSFPPSNVNNISVHTVFSDDNSNHDDFGNITVPIDCFSPVNGVNFKNYADATDNIVSLSCFNYTSSSWYVIVSGEDYIADGDDGVYETEMFFDVDTSPPNITISSPSNTTYNANSIWFNATLDKTGDTCLVDFGFGNNTMTNSSGNWNYFNASMLDGVYTSKFFCNDTSGNIGYNVTTFTISAVYVTTSSCYTYTKNDTYVILNGNIDSGTSNCFTCTNLINLSLDCNGFYVNSTNTISRLFQSVGCDNITIKNCILVDYNSIIATWDVGSSSYRNPTYTLINSIVNTAGSDATLLSCRGNNFNTTSYIYNTTYSTIGGGHVCFIDTYNCNVTAYLYNTTYGSANIRIYGDARTRFFNGFDYQIFNITTFNATSGSPIPNANISFTDNSGSFNTVTTTDSSGAYKNFILNANLTLISTGAPAYFASASPYSITGMANLFVNVSYPFSVSQDGTFKFYLSQDIVSPIVTIQFPQNILYYTPSIWFNATMDDTFPNICIVNWGQGNRTMTNSSGNWNYLNSSMPEGSYTANFYCNDTIGNTGFASTNFIVVNSALLPYCRTLELNNTVYVMNQSISTDSSPCFSISNLQNITIDCRGFNANMNLFQPSGKKFISTFGSTNITVINCNATNWGNFILNTWGGVTSPHNRYFYILNNTVLLNNVGNAGAVFLDNEPSSYINNTIYMINNEFTKNTSVDTYVFLTTSSNITAVALNMTYSGSFFLLGEIYQSSTPAHFDFLREWYYDIDVKDSFNNNSISNATVNLSDSTGIFNYRNQNTDTNGLFSTILSQYELHHVGVTFGNSDIMDYPTEGTSSNPQNINVSQSGFAINNTQFNVTGNGNFTVYMNRLAPTITFQSQTPADINSFNAFASNVMINYSITSDFQLATATMLLYYKTNTSIHDYSVHLNGSLLYVNFVNLAGTNVSSNWLFLVDEDHIYPATYNLLDNVFEDNLPSLYNISLQNDAVKIRVFNVSNTDQYSFFEMMVGNLSSPDSLDVYYCNETYTTGAVSISSYCTNIYTVLDTTPFNHTHSAYSSHFVIPLGMNNVSGMIDGVKVTNTSYFILSPSSNSSGWNIYYLPNVTRSDTTQTSLDGGLSWSDFAGTVNAHLHQYDGTESLYYFVNACDVDGLCTNSTLRRDLLETAGLPPSEPIVYAPLNRSYNSNMTMSYEAAVSPNAYPIVQYNLSLMTVNLTFFLTIYGNNSFNLTYDWDTSFVPDGSYRVRVEACDNLDQCSFGYSAVFTLDRVAPVVNIILPVETGKYYDSDNIDWYVTSDGINDVWMLGITGFNTSVIDVFTNFTSGAVLPVPEGLYVFNFSAMDSAGNLNSSLVDITVLSTAQKPPFNVLLSAAGSGLGSFIASMTDPVVNIILGLGMIGGILMIFSAIVIAVSHVGRGKSNV